MKTKQKRKKNEKKKLIKTKYVYNNNFINYTLDKNKI